MIAERIKELRNLKKISQNELAKHLQVSQQTIGAWEVGRTEPSIEFTNKMADYFNVTADYLLGRTNVKSAHSAADEKDLKEFLDQNLESGMRYDDQELTEEDKERLKIALTQIFWKHHNDM